MAQYYVLVDRYKIHVEHFHRLDDGRWILQEFNQLKATLHLETLGATLPLQQIYQNVTWEE